MEEQMANESQNTSEGGKMVEFGFQNIKHYY